MNKSNIKKIIALLTIILIVSIFYNYIIIEETKDLEEKVDELIYKKDILTTYKSLTSGNSTVLHDPLEEKVLSFIENDTSENLTDTIKNAKNSGIRCALVHIILNKATTKFELIAFDTVDKGMLYFEHDTDYIVYPRIARSYVSCVYNDEGEHPYYKTFDDIIIDIITIW